MHNVNTYNDARSKPAVVYWIHYPEQSNPFHDGYIGISTNVSKRVAYHKSQNKHMFNRLMKGAVIEILHEYDSLDAAAIKEKEYRPLPNIGWNINAGGDIPPPQKGKSRQSNKQALRGENRTEEQKKASKKHSKKMQGNIPHNKGKGSKIEINGVVYKSSYEARDKLNISLSKVYRIGIKTGM